MTIRNLSMAGALAMILTVSAAFAATETYTIDRVHSGIGFKVRHMLLTDVRGSFGSFSGTVQLDPASIEASSVDVTIDATSITTGNERRDADLKSENFFDVAKYPTLSFKSKKITKKGDGYVALGDFTMHGVTKEIELPFTLAGPVSLGQTSGIGVSARATLNRFDYGLTWDKKLEAGGLVVGETVTIEIDLEAKK